MLDIDKDIFDVNLKLTQAFCEQQINLFQKEDMATILRSFNPIFNNQKLFTYESDTHNISTGAINGFVTTWQINPLDDKIFLLNLFEHQLRYKKNNVHKTDEGYQGRILVAQVDNTVTDGASESASDGIIDVYDLPPIDTWFYLTEGDFYNSKMRYLFAWIPSKFCPLIDDAIAVNCVDCISWFNESKNDESKATLVNLEKFNEGPEKINFWHRLKNIFATSKL